MKIIGVFAVIASCIGIGMTSIQSIRAEMHALEALERGIRIIRSELSSRCCPMAELLAFASEAAGADAGGFFQNCAEKMAELNEKSFAALWADSISSCLFVLSVDNQTKLKTLGASLGRYELNEQLTACDRYLQSCEAASQSLRSRLPEQRKLCIALSLSAGIFLCLLIL